MTKFILTILFLLCASAAHAAIVFTSENVSGGKEKYKRPETDIVILDPDNGSEKRITKRDNKKITYEINSNPVVSKDGSRIAYSSFRIYFDENLKIWKDWNGQVCTVAYGKPYTEETYLYGYAYYPSRQYYASMLSGNWNIFSYDVKRGKEKQISFFKWDELVPQFIGGTNTLIYWIQSEKSVFILKKTGDKRGFRQLVLRDNEVVNPDVSPDGRLFAYQSYIDGNWELYTMRIFEKMAERERTRLTRTSVVSEISPRWSPDGRKILFSANSKKSRVYDFYTIDIKTKEITQITKSGGTSDEAEWSPDGKSIVWTDFSNNEGPRIVVTDAGGKGIEKTVSVIKGRSRLPVWSPDGKRIAFISNSDGAPAIYVVNSDGTGLRKVSKSRAAWQQPAWY